MHDYTFGIRTKVFQDLVEENKLLDAEFAAVYAKLEG